MKKILIITLFFYCQSILSQTSDQLIRAALTDYIEGTAYNYQERIKNAFYEDANLYLTKKDQPNWVVPSKKYISWFKEENKGKYTGRVGKIVSIDVDGSVALAKVEILIPKAKLRFIDNFLMKKIDSGWKIMSKSAASAPTNKTGEKVLFVLSSSDRYGNSEHFAGNSYIEIVNAYDEFEKAGYNVDFVSQKGGMVPLVYINLSDQLGNEYFYNHDFTYQLKHTKKPSEVNPSEYKAIYYVGGSAIMYGINDNKEIKDIAMEIYEENKGVISSVCHGTAGIVDLKTSDGNYLVKDKLVSGYPDGFENKKAPYFKHYPFLIQKTIEKRGGKFKHSKRKSIHVEVDGRLVTGQNYQSATAVAQKTVEVLRKLEMTN